MKKTAFLLALIALIASAGAARADVVINGSDDFRKAVQACIDKINKTGGDTAKILSDLESSGHTIVIVEGSKPPNTTTPKDGPASRSTDAGGTGKGSDSTIKWGPNITDKYGDGTPRDPCASLLHEMSHARDSAEGSRDNRNNPDGIPNEEVKACTAENVYRKANGLPIRKKYGKTDLPPSAIPKDDAVDVKDPVPLEPSVNNTAGGLL